MQHYGKGIIKGHYSMCGCDECLHLRATRQYERLQSDPNVDQRYKDIPFKCVCSKCKAKEQAVVAKEVA